MCKIFKRKKKKAWVYQDYSQNLYPKELSIENKINEHRVFSQKMNFVFTDKTLCEAAKERVNYIIENNNISHNNFFYTRNKLILKGLKNVSEIIGYGYSTPHSTIKAWLSSESHRKSIEDIKNKYIGICNSNVDGKNLYVVLFSY